MDISAQSTREHALRKMKTQQLINILETKHGTKAPERADRESLIGLILMAEFGELNWLIIKDHVEKGATR